MPKKRVDPRIRTLIENGVKLRHRSFFVIVGDKARDQVVHLHYMLSKSRVQARPTVLWCYKKELGFSSNKNRRLKERQRKLKRGLVDVDEEDPFDLFLAATEIRYAFYKDSHKILGNTYGMLVLQDFEALTPNLLARTIETVEGGGIICLLLRTMSSLRQLYSSVMDVHERFRSDAFGEVVARFNERFLLSLGANSNCLVVDDELNVLPVSSKNRYIQPLEESAIETAEFRVHQRELDELKKSLLDTQPVGSLVSISRTIDQAKAILSFVDAISEKTLRSTVALTAARGRGKSAALGVSIAAAIAYGYSNIFVTSPSPENLKTLFEFVFKGFDAIGYEEHTDYEIVQSTNPDLNKAVVRVNIFKEHRQTIQYILPEDSQKLGQAELVVIDEAAAIPLPLVRQLIGPYLVFIASTINGYEGTGRSLSLKLIQQLREQKSSIESASSSEAVSAGARSLREVQLDEPIRYGSDDPIERWLYDVLCLDCLKLTHSYSSGCPHPSECDLFYVNRDTLFSFHKASEIFLQRMMALYVSSHYKNSPNDLQILSDSPAHQLFVLLGPVRTTNSIPEILCVVQVALEGKIHREKMTDNMHRGIRPTGDLIPYAIATQYQDSKFGELSGARIVRIATHPDYQRMGYGQRAIELLTEYYQGQFTDLETPLFSSARGKSLEAPSSLASLSKKSSRPSTSSSVVESDQLHTEQISIRTELEPLLFKLSERPAERLHYVGVSFGLTLELYKFWSKTQFHPVYLRLTQNDLTGEHSCIMLRELDCSDLRSEQVTPDPGWLMPFILDFRHRFLTLLSYEFRSFAPSLALSIVLGRRSLQDLSSTSVLSDSHRFFSKGAYTLDDVRSSFSSFDMKRLESYASNLTDYHVIIDLLPSISRPYFEARYPFTLSYTQAALLLGLGLQHKTVSQLESELGIGSNQILALFNKVVRKISSYFRSLEEADAARDLPDSSTFLKSKNHHGISSLDDDMEEAEIEGNELISRSSNVVPLSADLDEELRKYAIVGYDEDWEKALGDASSIPSMLSVSSGGKRVADPEGGKPVHRKRRKVVVHGKTS